MGDQAWALRKASAWQCGAGSPPVLRRLSPVGRALPGILFLRPKPKGWAGPGSAVAGPQAEPAVTLSAALPGGGAQQAGPKQPRWGWGQDPRRLGMIIVRDSI